MSLGEGCWCLAKGHGACFFRVKQSKKTGVLSTTAVRASHLSNLWNSTFDRGEWSTFNLCHFTPAPPRGKNLWYLESWVGLRDSLDISSGKRHTSCWNQELNPRLSSWYMCLCYAEWWYVTGTGTNQHSSSSGAYSCLYAPVTLSYLYASSSLAAVTATQVARQRDAPWCSRLGGRGVIGMIIQFL